MHHLFIINPSAGKGKKYKILAQEIKSYCTKNNIAFTIEMTETPLHATHLSEKYGRQYNDGLRIYAVGGDGTLNEVTKGILLLENHENVSLGVFPTGSGNDFSRNILSDLTMDVEAQINATPIVIDVLKVKINGYETFSINAVTVGWDSEIAINVDKYKKKPFMSGSGAYIFSLLKGLRKMKVTRPLKLTLDDEVIEDDFLISLSANGSYYGGGFKGAPLAKLDDGLLDLVMVKEVPLSKLPKLLINYQKGNHGDEKVFEYFKEYMIYKKTSTLKIESSEILPITVDGEGEYSKKLEIEVIPRTLNFLIP